MPSCLIQFQAKKETERGKADDYDVLVRELMFEKKGLATDRLKTEEEIAKAEMVCIRSHLAECTISVVTNGDIQKAPKYSMRRDPNL